MEQTKPMSEPMTDGQIEMLAFRHYYPGKAGTVFDAIREALRLAREPQWVSVKTELPQPGVDVIAYFSDGVQEITSVDTTGRWNYRGDHDHQVLFWMPLPAPPKPQ